MYINVGMKLYEKYKNINGEALSSTLLEGLASHDDKKQIKTN